MLPDIPNTKADISRQLRLRIRDVARSLNPFLRMGTTVIQHEGFTHSYEQMGTGIVQESLKEHAIPIKIKFSEVPDLIGDKLMAKVDAIAVESLVVLPAFSSHYNMTVEELAKAYVTPGTVRVSIGIEDPEDLIADLKQALA